MVPICFSTHLFILLVCFTCYTLLYVGTNGQQVFGTAASSVWHFIHCVCKLHQQSQHIVEQLDREFAAVAAVCVRQWIRHWLLVHNLSAQIEALVGCETYMLQHYFGIEAHSSVNVW